MKLNHHLFPVRQSSDLNPLNFRPGYPAACLMSSPLGTTGRSSEKTDPPADLADGGQSRDSGGTAVNGTHLDYVVMRSGEIQVWPGEE